MQRLVGLAGWLLLAVSATLQAQADLADGLVAHWTFDQTSDDKVSDVVGGCWGTAVETKIDQPSLCGKSGCFSSARNSYVDLGDRLQLSDASQVTIAAVVRARSWNPVDLRNRANSRNGVLGSDDGNLIFGLTDRGRPMFVWDAAEDKYQAITADRESSLPLDQWCHVAVTRNGRLMTLYVNGLACRTEQVQLGGKFMPLNRCRIGRVNGSTGRDFDGCIDDLRVYKRALDSAEVHQLARMCGFADKPLQRPIGSQGLERVRYNHPGLVVDLGVGLWAQPIPIDYDGDGDMDLVVSCLDKPYNGTYFFENPGGQQMPVFKSPVRIGGGLSNVQVSYVGGKPRVLSPNSEVFFSPKTGIVATKSLGLKSNIYPGGRVRANQWKYADFDGDDRTDLIVGVGDWSDYGWDNAFDVQGRWTRGPLHGYVYLLRNRGTNATPDYAEPVKLTADSKPVDVYGMPSPNLADFDGDGDLDLLCGEFVDTFTYFENVGTRTVSRFRAGRKLKVDGRLLRVDLCMPVVVGVDWDHDGDTDLVVGQEDGRVMLIEHSGRVVDGMPCFKKPEFFRQQADVVKFGALVTPFSVDWDRDGDEDLICGNTAGYIGWIENLDGGCPPKWAAPRRLTTAGKAIRVMAGPNGSIQGPCEAKWGYTTLNVADWDHDGLLDLIVNTIWGKVIWFRNIGAPNEPKLAAAQPIQVQWAGAPPKPAWNWWNPTDDQLATQWRTTPIVIDWNHDGLRDLVMLDQEGYLVLFRRVRSGGALRLLPGERLFVDAHGRPLRLNAKIAGGSGRRKLCFGDWDRDGEPDLLANSRNISLLKGADKEGGKYLLDEQGMVDTRPLAGHTTSPTLVDWDRDGTPDLLVGAEDGHLYYLRNPHVQQHPK